MSNLWLGTWWEVYGGERQLRAVTLPKTRQAWPIYQKTRRHLRHWALMGNDYCRHSLSQPADIPSLAAQLAAERRWDKLTFTSLPLAQAELWRDSLRQAHLAASMSPARQQRYFPFDRPWSQIEADFRPGLLRNVLKRERALKKLGPLQLRVHTEAHGLDAIFAACIAIEVSGWKGEQGTAIASRPEAHRFYRTLAFRAAEAGALHLALLFSCDTLIAFSFDLLHGPLRRRLLAGLKVGHRDDWRRFAPGMVLKYRLLQRLHQDGLAEFDLSGGDDRYNADWTPHTRALADVHAFNRTTRGRAATLLSRSRAAVGARLHLQSA